MVHCREGGKRVRSRGIEPKDGRRRAALRRDVAGVARRRGRIAGGEQDAPAGRVLTERSTTPASFAPARSIANS